MVVVGSGVDVGVMVGRVDCASYFVDLTGIFWYVSLSLGPPCLWKD